MLVSRHAELIEFARSVPELRQARPTTQPGLNFRLSEFTAALGIVGDERLDEIAAWKNRAARDQLDPVHPNRGSAARGNGLRPLQVHRLRPDRALDRQGLRRALPSPVRASVDLPNTDWVAREPLVRAALLPARWTAGEVTRRESSRHGRVVASSARTSSTACRAGARAGDLRPRHSSHHDPPTRWRTVHRRPRRPRCPLRRAMRGCDAIIHLAAVADVSEVVARPASREIGRTRTAPRSMLEAARHGGIDAVRLRQHDLGLRRRAGRGAARRGRATRAARRTSTRRPSSPARCTAARTPRSMALEQRSCASASRYGPRARPAAVVPSFVARAQAGEPLTIAGDGTPARQFVYVEDLADGHRRCAAPRGARPGLQPRRRDEQTSVRQIADTVRDVVAPVPIVHGPERPGDVHIAQISRARAADELGWQRDDAVRRRRRALRRLAVHGTSGSPSSRRRRRGWTAAPRPSCARSRRSCSDRRRAAGRRRRREDREARVARSSPGSPAGPSPGPSATTAAAASRARAELQRRAS